MHMLAQTIAALVAAASFVSANSVTFVGQDNVDRQIIFTPNAGLQQIPSVEVKANQKVVVQFPVAWVGNWFAVSAGAPIVPGMLGEVAFDAYAGSTFFDVSAIVNPLDINGVKEIFPAYASAPTSGCAFFPCDNAYYHPDDVQTKSTPGGDLICTLGTASAQKREVEDTESPNFKRDFVMGKF